MLRVVVTCLVTLFGAVHAKYDWDEVSPMDEYVNWDDGYYNYTPVAIWNCGEYTLHALNMTSQKWMDESVTTTPVWWHQMFIAIPKVPRRLDAFHLYIDGFTYEDSEWPSSCDSDGRIVYLGEFAISTGAIAAAVRQVPFQPTYFTDSPTEARYEDQIIARTWRYYIQGIIDDPNVVLPVPMVKAAKRAVDTVIDYAPKINPDFQLTRVMPAGISKRGWTTWLLAGVDKRVFAMVPIVLTLGRWHDNLMHHYRSYGGWSWAMSPYYNENVTQYINDPRAYEIFDDIGIDFMTYNQRLNMPKLIIHASGDEFFLNDDPWYFFTELRSPKYLLICENAGHTLGGHEDRVTMMTINFFEAALAGPEFQWPSINWARTEECLSLLTDEVSFRPEGRLMLLEDSGTIGVNTSPAPLSVTAWWADTTNRTCDRQTGICRRDFRLTIFNPPGPNPVEWVETEVTGSNGNYKVEVPKRDDEEGGYRAFFMSFVFAGARPGDELHFTTEVNVLPNNLPYDACLSPEECYGKLK